MFSWDWFVNFFTLKTFDCIKTKCKFVLKKKLVTTQVSINTISPLCDLILVYICRRMIANEWFVTLMIDGNKVIIKPHFKSC